jgi:hypothetical protein
MSRATVNKAVASLTWLAAVYTTYLFLVALGVTPGAWGLTSAVLAQGMLTWLEGPVWQRKFGDIGVFAVVVDTLVNAGGLWPYIRNIDQTPTWAMFQELGAAGGDMNAIVAGFLALMIGYVLAKAPETIWRSV